MPPFMLPDDSLPPGAPGHCLPGAAAPLAAAGQVVAPGDPAGPHIGVFTGGSLWFSWRLCGDGSGHDWPELIGILAIIAAVVLLVTGPYPRQIFDLLVGLNRWVLRVTAYAALTTDKYPPFRLDQGGDDPDRLQVSEALAPGSSCASDQ